MNPTDVIKFLLVVASQTTRVLSQESETTLCPSGEKAKEELVCPRNGPATTFPVSASQIQRVLSADPDANLLPSGEGATEKTFAVCPLKDLPRGLPFNGSMIWILASLKLNAIFLASGDTPSLADVPERTRRDLSGVHSRYKWS
jgi:hypothetical protein